ncbi:unnamed protein product [Spirodela intermedia]|uniref:Uncharacterized protein n=1 Tax=Spirodela intermedia TaxID=51605 RepID=A0A7I8JKV4_SPIIN|nr:unnamed protein product [Spirodela intermedia]CAA6670784.1 unnamed protein product [Spirodela intermedia]
MEAIRGEGKPGSQADKGEQSRVRIYQVLVTVEETNGEMSRQSKMGKPEGDEIGVGKGGDLFGDSVESAVRMVNSQPSPLLSESPHLAVVSNNLASPVSASSSTTKGFGLKKWRRIMRDTSKDGCREPDASRVLKRVLSIAEPSRNRNDDKLENDCKADISIGSLELGHMQGVLNDMSSFGSMDPELELLVARTDFSLGTDSENSDDRSSKSSSTVTALKHKREGLGYMKERNRVRIPGGKASRQAVLSRGQGWKGCGNDAEKKESDIQTVHEEENSHSSVESDLRSSSTVVAQWHGTGANGSPSETSMNFDGENSGNTEDDRGSPTKHAQGGRRKRRRRPLAESIVFLQRAQEALDKGDLKLREMELERDILIRRNIEAEIGYLMLMSTVQQQWVIVKGDPSALHEQKNAGFGGEQSKLEGDEEQAIVMLMTQLEELDLTCQRLLGSKKALTLRNRVCKVSICCFIQFLLSLAALVSFSSSCCLLPMRLCPLKIEKREESRVLFVFFFVK